MSERNVFSEVGIAFLMSVIFLLPIFVGVATLLPSFRQTAFIGWMFGTLGLILYGFGRGREPTAHVANTSEVDPR